MKNKLSLLSLPLVALLVTSCVGKTHYDSKEYYIPLEWTQEKSFRVLQLGDIHFSQSDVFEEHFAIMDKTIKTANPDLIVLNGDAFTFADKYVVNKLFSFIDSYNAKWTYTFGNHDDQGYYRDTYIPKLLTKGTYKNALFKNLQDDDVTGRSNFVINLQNGEDIKYNIFVLESHATNFDTMGYDFIKQDQIDWFERLSNDMKKDGEYIPSSVYMHIAPPEFYTAGKEAINHPEMVLIGSTDEWEGGPEPESDKHFFAKAKECGLLSMHCAHDHINDSVILYEDVYCAFGVHATDRIYRDDAKIGGQVLIINPDCETLNFENIYVNKTSLDVRVEAK